MSYRFRHVFLSLLPKGDIYQLESFVSFVEKLSKEFDRAKQYIETVFFQIPGEIEDEKIIQSWEEFLGLPDTCSPDADRQKAIISRLSEYGGGSLDYLQSIASRAAEREIVVENSDIPMIFEVIGINLHPRSQITSRSSIRRPLRTFEREEGVICAVERVKHAHIDSRYYNHERNNHAQN